MDHAQQTMHHFLSLTIDQIKVELSTIGATLLQFENNVNMIKFNKDTQHMLRYTYQGFLKGLIFKKDVVSNEYEILSVSYHVPTDTAYIDVDHYNVVCGLIPFSNLYVCEEKPLTLLKLAYYDGEWHLSTNGVVDAYINVMSKFNPNSVSYGSIFNTFNVPIDNLQVKRTYVFGLNSTNTKLYHVATMDNETLTEVEYVFPSDSNVSYFESATDMYGVFSTTQYMMVHKPYLYQESLDPSNRYTYRYLFPSLIREKMIDSIVKGNECTTDFNADEYAQCVKDINDMYTIMFNKYWEYKTTKTVTEPHIKETINNIHNLEYKRFLQPKKLSLKVNNVIHYFKTYSSPREIKYVLNDIKVNNITL